MKIRKTVVVLAVIAALGATGASLAAYSGFVRRGGGGMAGPFVGRLIDEPGVQEQLKLTPEQVTKLHAIRDQARTTLREVRATTIRARADLRAALLDTKASRQDIEKSAAAVRDAVSAVSQQTTKSLLDMREVLTVDQREELRTIMRERAGTARRRFGRWRRQPMTNGDQDGAPSEDGAPGESTNVE